MNVSIECEQVVPGLPSTHRFDALAALESNESRDSRASVLDLIPGFRTPGFRTSAPVWPMTEGIVV